MSRVTLYSRSPRSGSAARVSSGRPPRDDLHASRHYDRSGQSGQDELQPKVEPAASPSVASDPRRLRRVLWLAAGVIGVAAIVVMLAPVHRLPPSVSAQDVDELVSRAIDRHAAVSPAARAYRVIAPSVVRVRVFGNHDDQTDDAGADARGIGTGVVIVDEGIILTNLHVVAGAKGIRVVFINGQESDATLVGARPEHDLAVLRADVVPDDLVVATMRSTADLAPGAQVVAVGFPFGLGPSVSAGVVSGLRRDFTTPEGERVLSNLIQFDAAANPGSSGGPLVTMDGEVVGIVTGILNPSGHGVFAGIGFAVPIENAAAAAGLSPF
jgi:S1-C subfamily serine protease